jgi:hypothetical protein
MELLITLLCEHELGLGSFFVVVHLFHGVARCVQLLLFFQDFPQLKCIQNASEKYKCL